MPNWIRTFFIVLKTKVLAHADAKLHLYQPDDRLRGVLGMRPPEFDPANREDHREIARLRSADATIEDYREDLREQQRRDAMRAPWIAAGALVLFLYLTEVAASQQLITDIGVERGRSLVFALMFSAVIFVLAGAAAHKQAPTTGEAVRKRWADRWMATWPIAIYVLVIAAIGLIRFDQIDFGDDSTPWAEAAVAFILVIFSIGPGVLAEKVIRSFVASWRASRQLHQTRKLLRDAVRKQASATAIILDLEQQRDVFDANTAFLRAVYDATHKARTQKLRLKALRRAGREDGQRPLLSGSTTEPTTEA